MSLSSFKIFVCIFPSKQIGFENNSIVLQTPNPDYIYAQELGNNTADVFGNVLQSCQTKLLDCEQEFVVPPPDDCGGGTGPQGPQGLPGRDGLQGPAGKCIIVSLQTPPVIVNPDALEPSVSITQPIDGSPCQTQQLQFTFPDYGGGGGGGETNVTLGSSGQCGSVHGTPRQECQNCTGSGNPFGNTTDANNVPIMQGNVSGFRLDPGVGLDIGVKKQNDIIYGVLNVKTVGFIKIFAVGSINSGTFASADSNSYGDSANRFVYYGHPSRYVVDNNCSYPPSANRFEFSDQELRVLNLAENDSLGLTSETPSSIPAFTPNGFPADAPVDLGISCVLIPLEKETTPGTTIVFDAQDEIIVPLYMGVDVNGNKQYFINHKNHLEKGFRGTVIDAVLVDELNQQQQGNGCQNNTSARKAIWKYKIDLGEAEWCAGLPTSDYPQCAGESWGGNVTFTSREIKNLGKTIEIVYAYNLLEMSIAQGYGIKLDATAGAFCIPNEVGGNLNKGFKLKNSPDFYFSHIPIGNMVEVKIDRNGRFYVSAPNSVVGGCQSTTP